jgi:hypothetical protein
MVVRDGAAVAHFRGVKKRRLHRKGAACVHERGAGKALNVPPEHGRHAIAEDQLVAKQ